MTTRLVSGGTVLPGFLDAHVHLALIDPGALAAGGISRVIDLGGWPSGDSAVPNRAYANQFLTAPGGYPTRTEWADPAWSYEITGLADAVAAVDAQAAAGASVVKVTLNSVAGPVLTLAALTALVLRSHELGVPVVAHPEGLGQAEHAWAAGVDAFAHTPFSEVLSDDLVAAMAARMTWISTLDIHGWGAPTAPFEIATNNLRRFHAAGGRVLYGTDLGNGPLALGVNRREIEALLCAGLSADVVLTALCTPTPLGLRFGEQRVTFIAGERPRDPRHFVDWLCSAQSLSPLELEAL